MFFDRLGVSSCGRVRGESFGYVWRRRSQGHRQYFQSLNLGIDYKHFEQRHSKWPGRGDHDSTTYYPYSQNYSATGGEGATRPDPEGGSDFRVRVGDQIFFASRFNAERGKLHLLAAATLAH